MSLKQILRIMYWATALVVVQSPARTESNVSVSRQFVLMGEGTGTSTSTGGGAQGTAQSNLLGRTPFTLTFVNGKLLGDNGSGGTCSLESGDLQLTTNQGTITMKQVGTSCNASGPATANTLNATYLAMGGTGRFQGVTGTGSLVVGFSSSTGQAQALIRLDGLLK